MLTVRIAAFVLRAIFASGADAPVAISELPEDCRAYAWLPADADDDSLGWNQLLSLASCLQDGSIAHATNPDELEPMVAAFSEGLAMPSMIYVAALARGPGPVEVRAAYQLGMAHVALVVRARSSVTSRELRERLEPLLARSLRLAWLTFSVIDRAVREDPTLAPDAVTQNEVRSARALLRILPTPEDWTTTKGSTKALR